MRVTGEKFRYELISDYILNQNPSPEDVMKEFGVSRDYVYSSIQNVENEVTRNYLNAVIRRNAYRDLKGYQMYKFLVFNPTAGFKEIKQTFNIRDRFNFRTAMNHLIEFNPSLKSEVEALIKRV